MKNHRFVSFLLVLSLLVALLAGCSSGSKEEAPAEASETAQSESEAPAASDSQPSEASAEAPSETPPAESFPAESAPEASVEPLKIDSSALYPVFDEVTTVTAFLNIAPWASAYIGEGKDFENAKAILVAEEKTNVHLDVTWSDPDTYNEKVNLMIVGGDYPDILRDISRNFTGGFDTMIDEGVSEDLTPYFAEYAPNYNAVLEQHPKFKQQTVSSSGVTCCMYSYTEIPLYTRGPIVRKDMLDAAGVAIPTTVDELHDVALALKQNGVEFPIVSPSFVAPAYAAADLGGSNMAGAAITWYAIDGNITPALTLDSMYDFLAEMKAWNDEGLFVEDWYNPLPWYDNYVLSDRLAIAKGPYSLTSDASRQRAADPTKCLIYPMANVVLNKGDTIKTIDNTIGGKGDGDWCITTHAGDKIPQLVSYINWFFTEEGSTLSNFGVEDESFTYDADGKPQFTDLVLKDPNGYGSMAVYAIFTNNNDNPFYFQYERTALTYDNEIEGTVYDTWLSNITSDYIYTATMTTEETEEYNQLATDITTTTQEKLSMFITGDADLSEWDSFIDSLNSLGLDQLRELVQTAYDRSNP